MTQESNRGDINISRIPVEGVGGLGLLAMAGIVTYFVEPLRWLGVATLAGGTVIGLVLLATRHRELRRLAIVLMAVLGVVLAGEASSSPCSNVDRIRLVKIETFLLERWMTRHETHVRYDIAESGILPLSTARPAGLRAGGPARRDARAAAGAAARLQRGARHGGAARRCSPRPTRAATRITSWSRPARSKRTSCCSTCCSKPGDHVIAPYPAYQQLYSVPKAIGCDVSLWHVGPETGYRYDVDALERLVTPQARRSSSSTRRTIRRARCWRPRTRRACTRWPSRWAPR